MNHRHSPLCRGIQNYFQSSLNDQAFQNYCAMVDEDRLRFAQRVSSFHEDCSSVNPFRKTLPFNTESGDGHE